MTELSSEALAQYMEATDKVAQPWLLLQLRLKKLQAERETLGEDAYLAAVAEAHQALMDLGEWWVGRESEVF